MARFGASIEDRKSLLVAHLDALDPTLRERLAQRGLKGSVRLALSEPAPAGTELLSRTHPLTSSLAETLIEASLDPEALTPLGIGRVGAWPSDAIDRLTRVLLLRIRYKLTVHARRERLLLAEEAAIVALQGERIVATDEAARALLAAPATADLTPAARDRFIARAHDELPARMAGPLADHIRQRAAALTEDHARLRSAAGTGARVAVEPVTPPDVIGLFTLLPAEG
jgi:hypothetical protein